MDYALMDTGYVEDGLPSNVAVGITAEGFSPALLLSNSLCFEMSLPELAAQCLRELGNYRRGEPCTDAYGLELLRRATFQDNQEAWAWVQHCFGGMVRGWLRRHPQREVACRLESEENYVAQTFERFWQATALNQRVEFSTLAAALQYLHASLNGAILDMLRAYARPREIPLPEPGEPGEPVVEESTDSNSEVWKSLLMILSNPREQRLAYLLFHCGLKPREIIRFCPLEWSDVQEIYRLRRNIMERVLRKADYLRWWLS
jgi:DNA-directed RNA polymerase specialized sigma24 family protein